MNSEDQFFTHIIWAFVVTICVIITMATFVAYNDYKITEYAMDKGYIQKIDDRTYRTIWVKDDN